MSQLRQRAQQVVDEGALQRGRFNPDANAVHYRVYRWWLHKSGKIVERENFCHYWRVVFIWAPLRWLRWPLGTLVALGVLGVGLWQAALHVSTLLGVLVTIGIILYVAYAVRALSHLLTVVFDDPRSRARWSHAWLSSPVGLALVVLSALPIVLSAGAVLGAVFGLAWLGEKYDIYRRFGRWLTGAHLGSRPPVSWLRPWLAFPVALIVNSFFFVEALKLLLVFCGALVPVGGGVLAAWWADRYSERQKQLKEQQRQSDRQAHFEVLMRVIFAMIHPEWQGQEERFQYWLARYDDYCRRRWGRPAVELDEYYHVRFLSYQQQELILIPRQRSTTPPRPVKPSRIKRFLTGTLDFLVLLWSVVLVKKWRICPLVELPEGR